MELTLSTCTLCVTGSLVWNSQQAVLRPTICVTGAAYTQTVLHNHDHRPILSYCVEQFQSTCITGPGPVPTLCVTGTGRLCLEQAKAHSVCNTNRPGPLCVEQAQVHSMWYRSSAAPLCVVKTSMLNGLRSHAHFAWNRPILCVTSFTHRVGLSPFHPGLGLLQLTHRVGLALGLLHIERAWSCSI